MCIVSTPIYHGAIPDLCLTDERATLWLHIVTLGNPLHCCCFPSLVTNLRRVRLLSGGAAATSSPRSSSAPSASTDCHSRRPSLAAPGDNGAVTPAPPQTWRPPHLLLPRLPALGDHASGDCIQYNIADKDVCFAMTHALQAAPAAAFVAAMVSLTTAPVKAMICRPLLRSWSRW